MSHHGGYAHHAADIQFDGTSRTVESNGIGVSNDEDAEILSVKGGCVTVDVLDSEAALLVLLRDLSQSWSRAM